MMKLRDYPFVIFGIGVKRWEKLKKDGGTIEVWDKGGFLFWCDRAAQKWGPSELQKRSRLSIFLVWPLCFKFSWYWKFQEPGIPGSELGLFWRIGFARWDPEIMEYETPSWYGPGLHDD